MVVLLENQAAKTAAAPALSVLIPYYHDDPSALLSALAEQVSNSAAEILIYDDGTNDAKITENLSKIAKACSVPVRLFFAADNHGRSFARNHLQQNARADWVLFLDADMRPQTDDFIAGYLSEIAKDKADIIFGGFTVPSTYQSADTELHRAFSQTSDCLSAKQRRLKGAQYVASSNLCVRTTVLDDQPFDTGFMGWGWEDSEWAARVAGIYRLEHVDLPALHLGLESTETLLTRFKNSGANYVRFTNAHPDLAKTLTLYKLSQRLKRLPGQMLLRPVLAFLVRANFAPTSVRLFALKFWRASWYAKAFAS